ncbi:TniQ family protein [Bacillus sp. 3255]|uniref:TniQ family protein n=1 Tax=Bacillus sp. 3255 TaxID=2817904 RepID=UPI002861459E|nr:TniQ family protein [Bacillus sp. 3255]MDR6885418.1 hypothetical protein [Bacillus sp. 3255]
MLRILRRPDPNLDESLRGYLARLASVNNITTMELYKELGLNSGRHQMNVFMLKKAFSLDEIAMKLQKQVKILYELTFHKKFLCFTGKEEIVNYIGRMGINCGGTKVCPLCLKESPHFRKVWDINLVTVCPNHNILLNAACSNCDREIRIDNKVFLRCKCGLDYIKLTTQVVDNCECYFAEQVNSVLSGASINMNSDLKTFNFADLVYLIMRLANVISSIRFEEYLQFRSKEILKLHQIIQNTVRIFIGWPNNFFSFLDELMTLEKQKKYDHYKNSFRRLFKLFYYELINSNYDFIRNQFESFIVNNWKEGLMPYNTLVKISANNSRTILAGGYAGKILRMSLRGIVSLIEKGDIEGIVSVTKKHKTVLVRRESLEKYQNKRETYMTKEEMMRFLQVNQKVAERLISSGIISGNITSYGKKIWLLSKNDIRDFYQTFYNNSNNNQIDMRDIISFRDSVRILGLNRIKVEELYYAVKNKKITPIFIGGNGFEMNSFYFKVQQIKNKSLFIEKMISVRRASSILKTSPLYIMSWIKRGFIKASTTKGNHTRINLEELFRFQNKYITLKEIMKIKEINTLKLLEEFERINIKALTGPQVDGGKGYLFLRADFAKLNLFLEE